MMEWLKQILGDNWNIKPAGGLTGDAYFAETNGRRLFLKRNSSPFLAVLSAEGIVPKLVWTKRMENGDVITAQEWLEGRKLEPEEMRSSQVTNILRKTHYSSELLHMLMRLGKRPVTSDANFRNLFHNLQKNKLIDTHKEIKYALRYLKELLPATRNQAQVVCHCDLNHNNLILTEHNQVYLIDWDNAMIADPVMDFGPLLKWYVPQSDWEFWLKKYGIDMNNQLIERMYWYLLQDALHYINWHQERNEFTKSAERLADLRELNHYIKSTILA